MLPMRCPPGYHYDAAQRMCVPDPPRQPMPMSGPPQQQQQQMNPMSMLNAYNKMAPMWGGQPLWGGEAAGGQAAGGGSSPGTALASNPYAWLAAAIAGTSWGLDNNKVSSFQNQLKGDAVRDILHSPNVNNYVDKLNLPRSSLDGLKHFDAMGRLDFKDAYKYGKRPIEKAFKVLGGLF